MGTRVVDPSVVSTPVVMEVVGGVDTSDVWIGTDIVVWSVVLVSAAPEVVERVVDDCDVSVDSNVVVSAVVLASLVGTRVLLDSGGETVEEEISRAGTMLLDDMNVSKVERIRVVRMLLIEGVVWVDDGGLLVAQVDVCIDVVVGVVEEVVWTVLTVEVVVSEEELSNVDDGCVVELESLML